MGEVRLDLWLITHQGYVCQTSSLLPPGHRSDSSITMAFLIQRACHQTFAWRHPRFHGCFIQVDAQHCFLRSTGRFQKVPPSKYRGHLRRRAPNLIFLFFFQKPDPNRGRKNDPGITGSKHTVPVWGPRNGTLFETARNHRVGDSSIDMWMAFYFAQATLSQTASRGNRSPGMNRPRFNDHRLRKR